MIKNRMGALAFRAGCFVFALAGLLSQLGVFRGKWGWGSFMYYTIQSNLLAVALFALLTIGTWRGLREDGRSGSAGYFARFEMICTVDLLLTFFVYWILLAPTSFSMDGGYSLWTFDNIAVHAVTPLLCLLDYVLFTQPRHLKYLDTYLVCVYPLFYVAFTSVAGLLGYVYYTASADGMPVRFPYFFFDFDRIGIGALAYIAVLLGIFIMLSHLFYFVDAKLRKPPKALTADDAG